MITNKRSQELLMLANTGKSLNKNAAQEEKKFCEECKHDYKDLLKPAMEIITQNNKYQDLKY